jgi:plastocyanin
MTASLIILYTFFSYSGAYGEESKEKNYKIILLHYSGAISQTDRTVKPGTTVIWVNNSKETLEIQFEGKQVTLACQSPVNFIRDENGSFKSEKIPHGSVASLCFVEKGEYSYAARKVQSESGGSYLGIQYFRDKIIVK